MIQEVYYQMNACPESCEAAGSLPAMTLPPANPWCQELCSLLKAGHTLFRRPPISHSLACSLLSRRTRSFSPVCMSSRMRCTSASQVMKVALTGSVLISDSTLSAACFCVPALAKWPAYILRTSTSTHQCLRSCQVAPRRRFWGNQTKPLQRLAAKFPSYPSDPPVFSWSLNRLSFWCCRSRP